jgi:hypothetical protein
MNNTAFTGLLKRASKMEIKNVMGDDVTLGYAIQNPNQIRKDDNTTQVNELLKEIWDELELRTITEEPMTPYQRQLLSRE